jgi:Domain of unknown function (DUF4296)
VSLKTKYWIFSLFVLILSGCDPIPISYTEPSLNNEQLAKILIDIHLVDAKLLLHPGTNPDSLATELYTSVFNKHQIKSADFQQSMNAVLLNPKQSTAIYKVVVDSLKAMQVVK